MGLMIPKCDGSPLCTLQRQESHFDLEPQFARLGDSQIHI